MKRLFFVCLCVGLVILILPAIAFLGQPSGQTRSNAASGDTAKQPSPPPTKEEQRLNRYYQVEDAKTGNIMELSPVEYIKGVVASEMPALYEEEALKAQAVAAHSYALVHLDQNALTLSTDPAVCQGFLSREERKELWGKHYGEYEKKLTAAVEAVQNEVLTVEKKPILAAFHAISSGKTETALAVWGRAVPYLTTVESKADTGAPGYETLVEMTAVEVSNTLVKRFPEIRFSKDKSKWFTSIKKSDAGTVTAIKAGDVETTGIQLREALGLRSADFDIAVTEKGFAFSVYGYGHFVGMSQYGANEMAKAGSTYLEILKHYYTGADLTPIR